VSGGLLVQHQAMAFRVVRQRREARRNAKLDEIFTVKVSLDS
jgi:hypothetical protein